MDVMRPELMWVDGICYRVNQTDSQQRTGDIDPYYEDNLRIESEECTTDEPCDEFDIEAFGKGSYKTVFHVPKSYFACIIGAKGATRKRLESETGTQIRVPGHGMDGDIVVTGRNKKGVSAVRRRINLIVSSARQRQPFTHFLSIPLTGQSIKEGFLKFKEEVLGICNNRGIDSSIFQSPEKLHLTIGTLVLADNEERKAAAEVLTECKESVIYPLLEHGPLKIQMIGIEYMNDDPAEVDVLYGKVYVDGQSNSLQDLADSLVQFFVERGLMQKQYEQVKIHATLMNTLFRSDKGGVSETETSKHKQKPRESFDATTILRMFEDFRFGEQYVDEIHLSLRYSTASSGYYQSSAVINLL